MKFQHDVALSCKVCVPSYACLNFTLLLHERLDKVMLPLRILNIANIIAVAQTIFLSMEAF